MSAKKKSGNGEWKIVIVEDSPTQAEQLKYILETHGYHVVAAGNGKEALALRQIGQAGYCHQRHRDARNGWLRTLQADQDR